MKSIRHFNLALIVLIPMLTSCTVNWGMEQYEVPWYILTPPLIIFSAILFTVSTRLIMSYAFRCAKCGKTFHPKWYQAILSFHIGSSRLFRCPHCGHKGMCDVSKDND